MKYGKCIISGYIDGKIFRPSNWSERLCEAGATFDPVKRIMRYSRYLYARQCDKYGSSVYVDFDGLDASIAEHVLSFVRVHGLELVYVQPTLVVEAGDTVLPPVGEASGAPTPPRLRAA